MTCFPVFTFLDECTEQKGAVKAKDLWATYRKWCREYGLSKLKPLHSFVKDVIAFMPQIQYQRLRNGLAGEITLHGVELRADLQIGDDSATPEPPPSMYDGGW